MSRCSRFGPGATGNRKCAVHDINWLQVCEVYVPTSSEGNMSMDRGARCNIKWVNEAKPMPVGCPILLLMTIVVPLLYEIEDL